MSRTAKGEIKQPTFALMEKSLYFGRSTLL
jgi:hypothetical protein